MNGDVYLDLLGLLAACVDASAHVPENRNLLFDVNLVVLDLDPFLLLAVPWVDFVVAIVAKKARI